jgi:hypothetical protein
MMGVSTAAESMIDVFNKSKTESIIYGLVINEKKTKYMKCNGRKQSKIEDLQIADLKIGQVGSIIYLGAIVNEDNSIEEIKERIALGIKAYYSNKRMFQNKLISRGAKLKLYWTVVKGVITYACETWVLKKKLKSTNYWFLRGKS